MSILDTDLLNVLVEYYMVRMGTKPAIVESFYKFYGFDGQSFNNDPTEFIDTYDAVIHKNEYSNAFINLNNKNVTSGLGPAMYMFLKCIYPESSFIKCITSKLTDRIHDRTKMTSDSGRTIKPFVYSYLYEHHDREQPVIQSLFKLLKNNNITDSDWKYLIQLVEIGLTSEDVKYLENLNNLDHLNKL